VSVAEVAGAVECVQAGDGQVGYVADVVEPRRGFEKAGLSGENGWQPARPRGDALDVRSAAGQAFLEEVPGEIFGP
jgi:hypothetical protein